MCSRRRGCWTDTRRRSIGRTMRASFAEFPAPRRRTGALPDRPQPVHLRRRHGGRRHDAGVITRDHGHAHRVAGHGPVHPSPHPRSRTSGSAWTCGRVSASRIRNFSPLSLSWSRRSRSPLTCEELAGEARFSTRQLERLFRKYLGHSPTKHYLSIRLERARYLLKQTSMPILSIAMSCGFVSASHFSKSYNEHFGRTPSAERRRPQADENGMDAA